jgi:hypothetical protein
LSTSTRCASESCGAFSERHVAHAELGECREVVFDQPVATDLEHRLREILRERAHALAATRGQDHGLQRG